jgi:hypothetical protein
MQEITEKLSQKLINEFSPVAEDLAKRGYTPNEIASVFRIQLNVKTQQYYDKENNSPKQAGDILAEVLSKKGIKQLRIAETEKYAHVTYFLNGGIEKPFAHEERVLIPSSKVATYDLEPRMRAAEIAERAAAEIASGRFGVIVMNFANPDMVGHTGKMEATVAAVEIDRASASRMGVLEVDSLNRILNFEEKPEDPKPIPGRTGVSLVNMGVYVFETAALIAATLSPEVKLYLIASHQSTERGHRVLLEHLGLKPLLNLDLRLGEGTGAALGIFLVEASLKILDEMATFSEASVSEKI